MKNPTNKLSDGRDVRYVHVSAEDTESGRFVTAAYVFDDEAKEIVYNSAQCSEKDQFVKATGRIKAKGRLEGNCTKYPNKRIPYSAVSEDGVNPRYSAIASEIYHFFVLGGWWV